MDTYNDLYAGELSTFNTESRFEEFRNPDGTEPHVYGTFTYDAMYAIAIALDKSERFLQENGGISLLDFNYTDDVTVPADADCKNIQNAPCSISDVIKRFMDETNLAGISVSAMALFPPWLCSPASITQFTGSLPLLL